MLVKGWIEVITALTPPQRAAVIKEAKRLLKVSEQTQKELQRPSDPSLTAA